MEITKEHIEQYLLEVRESVRANRFRIELNENRMENRNLFLTYNMDRKDYKRILLSLTSGDFSERVSNEHKGFEHEMLYIFGKDVSLINRYTWKKEFVPLYIKMNQMEDQYVIVISIHKQKYKLKYYFE